MRALIGAEIVRAQRFTKRQGLGERERQAVACDRIHAAGCIAYQRDPPTMDGAQRPVH